MVPAVASVERDSDAVWQMETSADEASWLVYAEFSFMGAAPILTPNWKDFLFIAASLMHTIDDFQNRVGFVILFSVMDV